MRLVGIHGELAGRCFVLGEAPLTMGRGSGNHVVLATRLASRNHAELRREGDGWTLYDGGSTNGTAVNGRRVRSHRLSAGDEIAIGHEVFRLEATDAPAEPRTVLMAPPAPQVLRVTVSGGGPVGLAFALMLDDLMGPRAEIVVYDGRWTGTDDGVTWKAKGRGSSRRQQVVTVQSRQWTKLPVAVQERLFDGDAHSEMWPTGPDSVDDLPPRNIRIAYIEDQLLAMANEAERIRLVPEWLDPADPTLADRHVLAVCEGSRSRTRDHFADLFGAADTAMYSLDGKQVQDVVLGLRVSPTCPTPWPCC
jgi:FHA domain-containing protein